MPLVTAANVDYLIGTRKVLNGVSFSVEPAEHVGIVGRNGCGKTTLMRLMAGLIKPDVGQITRQRSTRIGYLAQDMKFHPRQTLYDTAEAAFADLHAVHEQMHEVTHHMGTTTGDDLQRLMNRYEDLETQMHHLGGYVIEHRVEETLHGLGFDDSQFTLPVESLSGGQRARLALARLLLEEPDLLLLDEPTNHLDIDGRRWLEEFLGSTFPGAVVIVSHDRYLLDRVVHRIAELEPTGMISYPGNYAQFRELRAQRQLTQQRHWAKQQDRVRSEQRFIQRYKTGQRAKQARGRESRLERFKESILERPVESNVMRLTLPKAPRCGDVVVTADHLSKAYDERTLFADFEISVQRGERIGIIGHNGSGKSTLVRCLIGEQLADSGRARLGSNVSAGHFHQLHENLDLSLTVWQYLQHVILSIDGAQRASEQQARDLAGAFLFTGDDQDKTLGVLSGGERSRAILAGLVAGGHNLLVLDEPTNHFDIPSSERLEQALNPDTGYDGTLLLISHDRALLDACVDRIIAFEHDGKVRIHEGNYSSYLRACRVRRDRSKQTIKPQVKKLSPRAAKSVKTGKKRNGRKPNPKLSALSDKRLESQLEEAQKRVSAIDALFLDPALHTDGARINELRVERIGLVDQIGTLEDEWLQRNENG